MPQDDLHSEKKLLLQVADGDEAAFGRLFRLYFDHLYGFALAVSKSSVVAEEIVEDVFISVWKNREKIMTIDRFDAWLFILTRNQAYKTLRKKANNLIFVEHLEAYFALSQDSPEQQLLYKESQELLSHAAATLPPQQRLIFEMSRLQRLTLDEIAAQLQLSKNTVKAHLTKALRGIRDYLHEHAHSLLLFYCMFSLLS